MSPDLKVGRWRLLELPSVAERRGNLTFIQAEQHIPFRIERVYYISAVPGDGTRAGHAHRDLEEVLLCVKGRFQLTMDDGARRKRLTMDRPDRGVYIPPFVWHELESFSRDAVALGLASLPYSEEDHFSDYEEFARVARRPSV
jgi:mannose-6-phosphate isomerase-like protein (cupin superfamily)